MSRYAHNGTLGVKLVPLCKMEFRGGFHCCGIANPRGLASCPNCGKPAIIYDRDADDTILPGLFPANLFFAIAGFLHKIAKRIKRWSDDQV